MKSVRVLAVPVIGMMVVTPAFAYDNSVNWNMTKAGILSVLIFLSVAHLSLQSKMPPWWLRVSSLQLLGGLVAGVFFGPYVGAFAGAIASVACIMYFSRYYQGNESVWILLLSLLIGVGAGLLPSTVSQVTWAQVFLVSFWIVCALLDALMYFLEYSSLDPSEEPFEHDSY